MTELVNNNLYLIQQEDSDLYKIGVSKHTNKRLKENQTGNGNRLEMITTFQSDFSYILENAIHQIWSHKKTIGEWFKLTEDDVINFKTLCGNIEKNLNNLKSYNIYAQEKIFK